MQHTRICIPTLMNIYKILYIGSKIEKLTISNKFYPEPTYSSFIKNDDHYYTRKVINLK